MKTFRKKRQQQENEDNNKKMKKTTRKLRQGSRLATTWRGKHQFQYPKCEIVPEGSGRTSGCAKGLSHQEL